MEVVYPVCAGLDLGKRFLVACALFPDDKGKRQKEIRTFDTDTENLRHLGEWLEERGVTAVAMGARPTIRGTSLCSLRIFSVGDVAQAWLA